MIRDEKQPRRLTNTTTKEAHRNDCRAQRSILDVQGVSWDEEQGEEIVAALRSYFLTHTLDPLTGEIHTVH